MHLKLYVAGTGNIWATPSAISYERALHSSYVSYGPRVSSNRTHLSGVAKAQTRSIASNIRDFPCDLGESHVRRTFF